MFWRKKSTNESGKQTVAQKLPAPKQIPEAVRKYLMAKEVKDEALLTTFKAVLRPRPDGNKAFDVRIYDDSEAIVREVIIKDYTSLDENPGLIYYEGWFDKSGKVELATKKTLKPKPEVPIFSEKEIQQKIEGLAQPGGSVFFYLAGSPATGGPLGRGAAVVTLNPDYPKEKQRKYIMYTASVDGLEPVGKRDRVFDSDKPRDIARWIKERHYKPHA